MTTAIPFQKQPDVTAVAADFRAYLEHSLRDPFTLNLKDCSLMEVIRACVKSKSRLHPGYRASIGCLVYNLQILEQEYRVELKPVQVTDVFWGYFIAFCQGRGLRLQVQFDMDEREAEKDDGTMKKPVTISVTIGVTMNFSLLSQV